MRYIKGVNQYNHEIFPENCEMYPVQIDKTEQSLNEKYIDRKH